MCRGAPWALGNREVTCTAFTTCACGTGRMDTTSGPAKTPAGVVATLVLYMATLRSDSTWCSGMPAELSAVSKVKLQPRRKVTRSSRQ